MKTGKNCGNEEMNKIQGVLPCSTCQNLRVVRGL